MRHALNNPLFRVTYSITGFSRLTHWVHAPDISEAGDMADRYLCMTYNLNGDDDGFKILLLQEVDNRSILQLNDEADTLLSAHTGQEILEVVKLPSPQFNRNKILGMVVITMLLVIYFAVMAHKVGLV